MSDPPPPGQEDPISPVQGTNPSALHDRPPHDEQQDNTNNSNNDNDGPPGREESKDEEEEVRTLFISGLPHDVKERELYLLFRTYRGYDSCAIRLTSKAPVAFAVFDNAQSAREALDSVQNIAFDPESPVKLRVEFAKANTKPKRQREGDGGGGPSEYGDKRMRTGGPSNIQNNGGNNTMMNSPPGTGQYQDYGQYGQGAGNAMSQMSGYYGDMSNMWNQSSGVMGGGTYMDQMGMYRQQGSSNRPMQKPCSTLFIANLGPGTSEHEVRDILSRMAGFRKMRLNQTNGAAVAFAEFADLHCSTAALTNLQNYQLQSSDRPGGMRIEYAKNRMGTPSQREGGGGGMHMQGGPDNYP
eukprot:GFYU01007556.1.p1 GENE.GFYU01007556.1~~GFYU01007556.1.p1  ORF type:complete len:355 (+),score=89.21 GFYU01007556.1:183-1247(+)